MRVLVTGATGQLGHDVVRVLSSRGHTVWGVGSKELDITDQAAVCAFVSRYSPDWVVHCAAYTAVDRAEEEQAACYRVNVQGTANVAESCRANGAKLLYISTDYVFGDGGDDFLEVDAPKSPINVYGSTKLAGEQVVVQTVKEHIIVRISWVFGKNGGNFVKTMLRLAQAHQELTVVDDQIGSPTYTADLAVLLADMVEHPRFGIYHATNEGVCSWAEFARKIFALRGLPVNVKGITTEEYPAKAKRAKNSRLSKKSLQAAGYALLPTWEDALERYLKEIEE